MDYQSRKMQDLNTIRAKVRLILDEYPQTRNNDFLLQVLFLEQEGVNGWGKLMDAAERQLYSLETIRRARQIIQSRGEYLPTDETIIKRRRLQEVYRHVSTLNPVGSRIKYKLERNGNYSMELKPEQYKKQFDELQEQINPKPPKEDRERMINERIAARSKKVAGPSETK